MPTNLSKRKTRLQFVTCDVVRERGRLREVVIEAGTHYATVRLLGMRRSYQISYAGIYHMAARIAVEKERAEKKAAAKKGGMRDA
jgi:hypothetical protein